MLTPEQERAYQRAHPRTGLGRGVMRMFTPEQLNIVMDCMEKGGEYGEDQVVTLQLERACLRMYPNTGLAEVRIGERDYTSRTIAEAVVLIASNP